ncbi:MAG: hypothetical protein V7L00_14995 [Nostoc sp.]|nr:hypothetical protein [Nostoc sp. JL33]
MVTYPRFKGFGSSVSQMANLERSPTIGGYATALSAKKSQVVDKI